MRMTPQASRVKVRGPTCPRCPSRRGLAWRQKPHFDAARAACASANFRKSFDDQAARASCLFSYLSSMKGGSVVVPSAEGAVVHASVGVMISAHEGMVLAEGMMGHARLDMVKAEADRIGWRVAARGNADRRHLREGSIRDNEVNVCVSPGRSGHGDRAELN